MGVLGLGREAHFSEFNDPLADATGVLSPSARKALAQQNLGMVINPTTAGVSSGAPVIRGMPAVATATDTATLTLAQMLNGVIHGTPTAAANYTTQTGAQLDAALPDFAVGDAFEFSVVNLATANVAFDITMVGGTGVTVVGQAVIGAGPADGTEWKTGIFRCRRTGTATWTLIRVA